MLTTAPVALLSLALLAPSAAPPELDATALPAEPAATAEPPAGVDPFAEPVAEPTAAEAIASEAPTPSPEPASSPAPAAAVAPPIVARALDARPIDDRREAVEAFTARRGFRMATAGTAIAAAGVAWTGIAGWMLQKDDPRLGLSLAFAIDGAIATTVGVGLAIGGAKRSRNPSGWLAKRSSRRERMTAAASGFEPHAAATGAERNVVARGMKLRNYGFLTLSSGIGLLAFGTGMQFAYGGDALAPKIVVPVVSAPFIIAGAALLAAGGRRVYSPQRFVDHGEGASASRRSRVQLAAAPSFQRGSLGITLSGRF